MHFLYIPLQGVHNDFSRYGRGEFDLYHSEVTTLAWDPVFVPEVGLKGLTWNSISIGWNNPPENFLPYIHYYKLTKKTEDQEVSMIFFLLGISFLV